MLELRLKEKDHALRTAWIREKELRGVLDDYKKMQKAERLKAKRIEAMMALAIPATV
jgi:hypothetical protein